MEWELNSIERWIVEKQDNDGQHCVALEVFDNEAVAQIRGDYLQRENPNFTIRVRGYRVFKDLATDPTKAREG